MHTFIKHKLESVYFSTMSKQLIPHLIRDISDTINQQYIAPKFYYSEVSEFCYATLPDRWMGCSGEQDKHLLPQSQHRHDRRT